MTISRTRLSSDVHQELLSLIIRGEFAPGQRLKDTELAERLGVSRTPVREALLRLEREGLLSAQQHLGFSVKHFQESEIREVYPLVRILECSALESAPAPCPGKIAQLLELALMLEKEGSDPLRRIELDSAWHKLLIEDYGNQQLFGMLADMKRILFRYEYAFMQVTELVSESLEEHAAIMAALERGRRKDAVRLLGAHWNRCTEATLANFFSKVAATGTRP
jgi:DNA-binding GntR family transcriptional regulator